MNCREAQSLIVPFIENRLTDEKKEAFIQHVENCSECYDELEVYFIVFSGIRQLDGNHQDDISDFKGELKRYIQQQKETFNRRKARITRRKTAAILLITALLCAGGGIYTIKENHSELLHTAMVRVESLFVYNKAAAVKKSVEFTLDVEDWKKSIYKEIIRNEEVEDESDEENSTD